MLRIKRSSASRSSSFRRSLLLFLVFLALFLQFQETGFKNKTIGASVKFQQEASAIQWTAKGTSFNSTSKTTADSTSTSSITSSTRSVSKNCSILISSRVLDFHNEVLESIALQYPLPWDNLAGCQDAGLTRDNPIVVDYVLGLMHTSYKNTSESYLWGSDYFEPHLKGSVRQRHAKTNDARWIQFGNVVDWTGEHWQRIEWSGYSAQIENNCEFITTWKKTLRESPSNFCVAHHGNAELSSYVNQSCHLNPQHHPQCWFVPSDLPQFEEPLIPFQDNRPLKLCVPWKADGVKVYRDYSVLVPAIQSLFPTAAAEANKNEPPPIQVLAIGRGARVPKEFSEAGLGHLVKPMGAASSYYSFQQTIASCHVLVPLLHKEGLTASYFTSGEKKGSLSGMMSLIVGHARPSLLHSDAVDVYKELIKAPVFMYNDTHDGGRSATVALQGLLQHYHYDDYNVDMAVALPKTIAAHNDTVPHTIHLIYVAVNETCGPACKNGIDIHDILTAKSPRKLYNNLQDIIEQYQTIWNNDGLVQYHGTKECHAAILQTEPRLLPYYQQEEYGPHRSDICRLAVLYLQGGHYLDNDTKVIKPFLPQENVSFGTVLGLQKNYMANGMIFARPRHPIIKLALELTLLHYDQGIHRRDNDTAIHYDQDTGTRILYDAYHECIHDELVLKEETWLLEEIILKKRPDYMAQASHIPMKMSINFCTAAFISEAEKKVYGLARAPGTSYC